MPESTLSPSQGLWFGIRCDFEALPCRLQMEYFKCRQPKGMVGRGGRTLKKDQITNRFLKIEMERDLAAGVYLSSYVFVWGGR